MSLKLPGNNSLYYLIIYSLMLAACRKEITPTPEPSKKTDSIIDQANYLLNSGEINDAIHYIDSAYKAFPQAGAIDKWQKYSFLNNFYLNYQISPTRAERYTDSMFFTIEHSKLTYPAEYAQSIFAKGDVLRVQKRYNEAFEYYYQGRTFARKHLDSCEFSSFSNRLGLIRYAQQKYLKAIPYFKQALIENKHCGDGKSFEDRFILPQSIIIISLSAMNRPGNPTVHCFTIGKGSLS